MKAEYYVIQEKYLGKYEDRVYYLLKEEGWSEDKDGYIKGIQIGYDASDDDTPYAIGNIEIMDDIKVISKDEANEALVKLGYKEEPKFSVGQYVRYAGTDLVAYEKGKPYLVTGYDEKLDLYGVMSELDEDYLLAENILEELSDKEEDEIDRINLENYLKDDEKLYSSIPTDYVFYIVPYKESNMIDGKYKYNYDDCLFKTPPVYYNFEKYEVDGTTLESYSGYPQTSLWLVNKEQLIQFMNKHDELCSFIKPEDLKDNKYVLNFCVWD